MKQIKIEKQPQLHLPHKVWCTSHHLVEQIHQRETEVSGHRLLDTGHAGRIGGML